VSSASNPNPTAAGTAGAKPDKPPAPKPKPVTVHVNEKPVTLPDRRSTGLEIKQAAKDQGVAIELDFILVQELGGGRTQIIGDADEIHLEPSNRFLANDGDDNS
jgi:hypothetical protein